MLLKQIEIWISVVETKVLFSVYNILFTMVSTGLASNSILTFKGDLGIDFLHPDADPSFSSNRPSLCCYLGLGYVRESMH